VKKRDSDKREVVINRLSFSAYMHIFVISGLLPTTILAWAGMLVIRYSNIFEGDGFSYVSGVIVGGIIAQIIGYPLLGVFLRMGDGLQVGADEQYSAGGRAEAEKLPLEDNAAANAVSRTSLWDDALNGAPPAEDYADEGRENAEAGIPRRDPPESRAENAFSGGSGERGFAGAVLDSGARGYDGYEPAYDGGRDFDLTPPRSLAGDDFNPEYDGQDFDLTPPRSLAGDDLNPEYDGQDFDLTPPRSLAGDDLNPEYNGRDFDLTPRSLAGDDLNPEYGGRDFDLTPRSLSDDDFDTGYDDERTFDSVSPRSLDDDDFDTGYGGNPEFGLTPLSPYTETSFGDSDYYETNALADEPAANIPRLEPSVAPERLSRDKESFAEPDGGRRGLWDEYDA
jgi:hypothetical protein